MLLIRQVRIWFLLFRPFLDLIEHASVDISRLDDLSPAELAWWASCARLFLGIGSWKMLWLLHLRFFYKLQVQFAQPLSSLLLRKLHLFFLRLSILRLWEVFCRLSLKMVSRCMGLLSRVLHFLELILGFVFGMHRLHWVHSSSKSFCCPHHGNRVWRTNRELFSIRLLEL